MGRKLYKRQNVLLSGVLASVRNVDGTPDSGTNGRGTSGSTGLLARIERLALEELDAAGRLDWEEARCKVLEKSRLREEYHRLGARRLT